MKGITIKIQALLLCGVLITGLFSSCASDDNIETGTKVNPGDKVLTLTLNTPKTTTRATTGTNMTSNTDENKINRLTIGIFDNLGTTVRTIQELTKGSGTGFFTNPPADPTSTVATLITNSLAATDKVLVAVNAPSGTFNGCTDVSHFESQAIAIDVALATSNASGLDLTKEATDNIPMYGTGVIASPDPGKTTYTASVSVNHQLAKITVGKIKVDFPQNGPYANATFQPTSFFLINVPNDLMFNKDAWKTGGTSYWQGCPANTSASDYKAYLGTNIFTTSYSALKYNLTETLNTNMINPGSILYTIPNYSDNTNTKLVIGGEFNPDPSLSSTTTTVYYPVNINWVYDPATKTSGPAETTPVLTDAKKVYPNRNYTCNVTIKTMGATLPTANIDPNDIEVTVTVTGFTPVTQDTTFE